MDIKALAAKAPGWLKKYRYPILVLAIGLVLMVLPSHKQQSEQIEVAQTRTETVDPAAQLSSLLSHVQGVGKVEVLLLVKVGQTTIYQTDEDIITSETGSTVRKETVLITGTDRTEQPLISAILSPEYWGAVIVCQGADNVQVRLAVVEAVSKATGLGADKITVLKMK